MTPNEFKSELKKLSGGYLFCGEEDYLKRYYLSAARGLVTAEDDFFNRITLSEDNFSSDALMSAMEALPVMSERKFIEISGVPFEGMKESELEDVITVLKKLGEYEYNVLIISADFDIGTQKQPSKLFKALSSVLKPVIFDKETPSRLASWVSKHFAAELIVAPPDTVNLLLRRCNCDMSSLANEIKKLSAYLKFSGREKLTVEDVMLVSSESKEIEAFDLTNALLDGRSADALSIVSELKLRKEKPEIILSGITRVISELLIVRSLIDSGATPASVSQKLNMHSYRAGLYFKNASKTDSGTLKKLLAICHDADVRIKSTSLDSYAVIDRLTVEASVR